MCVLVILCSMNMPGSRVDAFGLALLLGGQRLQVQVAQHLGPAELPAPSVLCWSRAGKRCANHDVAELGDLMSEACL